MILKWPNICRHLQPCKTTINFRVIPPPRSKKKNIRWFVYKFHVMSRFFSLVFFLVQLFRLQYPSLVVGGTAAKYCTWAQYWNRNRACKCPRNGDIFSHWLREWRSPFWRKSTITQTLSSRVWKLSAAVTLFTKMNETDLDETHGAKLAKIELKKKVYRSAAVGKGRLGHLKHRGGGGGGGVLALLGRKRAWVVLTVAKYGMYIAHMEWKWSIID